MRTVKAYICGTYVYYRCDNEFAANALLYALQKGGFEAVPL